MCSSDLLTALRCVAVGGTRLKKTDAPEDIQRWVSIAASPNLQEMAARTLERKKRTRLPGASGKRAAAAGRMLKSTDAEVVQQGLELLAALDDPIVIDALLQDLTWKANGKGFMPASKRWGGRRCAFIALGLLALRPELRPDLRSVEFLRLTSRYGDANLRPFDLGTLHALPALTRLELVAVSPLLNDDPGQNPSQNGTVGLLPALQRVLIRGPVASLGFLARAPKLESVRLAAAGIVDVRGLATSGVARLDFHTAGPVDFAALAPCARLREIRVRYTKGLDYGRIGTIKSLRRLRVPKGTPLPALPGVAVTYG